MQWFSLVVALIAIVNILPCVVCEGEENAKDDYLATLSLLCPFLPSSSEHDNVTIALTEVKTLLQEAKAERVKAQESQSEIMTFLQEAKAERLKAKKSQSEIMTFLQEAKAERLKAKKSQSEIMTFLQEMKKSLSEVKKEQAIERRYNDALTESQSKVKTFLQEVKSEVVNIRKQNYESLTAITAMFFKKNCAELRLFGDKVSRVRTLYPEGPLNPEVSVFCDQLTDDGGWTVIQNRDDLPVRISFERSWQEYVHGFGDLKGEFWLGLDNLHALTSSTPMQLRVDMEDWEGEKRWAKYSVFRVGDPASKYLLSVGGYTGDAGDGGYGMTFNSGSKFTTIDQDNESDSRDCAKLNRSGWWFHKCTRVNPNGYPHRGNYTATWYEGIHWTEFRSWRYSLKKISLKIRPV